MSSPINALKSCNPLCGAVACCCSKTLKAIFRPWRRCATFSSTEYNHWLLSVVVWVLHLKTSYSLAIMCFLCCLGRCAFILHAMRHGRLCGRQRATLLELSPHFRRCCVVCTRLAPRLQQHLGGLGHSKPANRSHLVGQFACPIPHLQGC